MKILQVGNPEKIQKIKDKREANKGIKCPCCDARFIPDFEDYIFYYILDQEKIKITCPQCQSFIYWE